MNVLMIGVDETSLGGMLTVVDNYKENKMFCTKTNLKYIATVTNKPFFKKVLFFLKALNKIKKSLKDDNIDIVHIHMAEKGSVYREGVVLWYAKKYKKKTIVHMHGATIEEWYNSQNEFNKILIKKILNQTDILIALGYNWVTFLSELVSPEKVKVIYNAVQVPKANMYNKHAKEILFLGLLIQRKGIDDLLKAISNINNKLPDDIIVRLYGADRENNIEEKIKKLNLGNRVKYSGWLTNNMKAECFANTMINVLPSYNEGLPMTILETMAYGIPNISTNIAAIPEVITNNKDGILIQPGDITTLEKAILDLVINEKKRIAYSENSYRKICEKFSIEKHIDDILSLYSEMLLEEVKV